MEVRVSAIAKSFRDAKIRTKLIFAFAPLIAFPCILLGYQYYSTSARIITQNATASIYEVVQKNNEFTDSLFDKMEENSQAIMVDEDLFKAFNESNSRNDVDLLTMDRNLGKIIYKYFPPSNLIYSVNIVTGQYKFGRTTLHIPPEGYKQAALFQAARNSNGRLLWVPTFDYLNMFPQKELASVNLDYRYLFSAVRLINPSDIDSVITKKFEKGSEPILLVTFKADVFQNIFRDKQPFKEGLLEVVNEDGKIISHPDSALLGTTDVPLWLAEAKKHRSGTTVITENGRRMIVCYTTSRVTGWISAYIAPEDTIISDLRSMRRSSVYTGAVLTVLAILVAYFIAGIMTRPLKRLLVAIRLMGEGRFAANVPVLSNDEIGNLIQTFNRMDHRIQQLIEENYATQIREKEAEIMALNLQMNPHFLYNTLNTINWMAIENNQTDISKLIVSLSTMLQYTMHNNREVVSFRDDLAWLQGYIHIMKSRFEDKFEVLLDIDDSLMDSRVPKLFLQPFLENAVIHGFETIEQGGEIYIIGKKAEPAGTRIFTVRDNGCGMDGGKLAQIAKSSDETIGIQNVNRRIKLIYGDSYGVSVQSQAGRGTLVTVTLPSV
jgi:two-component system sensor histidine kinase YesM